MSTLTQGKSTLTRKIPPAAPGCRASLASSSNISNVPLMISSLSSGRISKGRQHLRILPCENPASAAAEQHASVRANQCLTSSRNWVTHPTKSAYGGCRCVGDWEGLVTALNRMLPAGRTLRINLFALQDFVLTMETKLLAKSSRLCVLITIFAMNSPAHIQLNKIDG